MRGRIRQLKPDLYLDDEFWSVVESQPTLHLHQAFTGLWCQADREGRFEWRPTMLKTQILPYWNGDFALCLEALLASGFIRRYVVAGKIYGCIRSFTKHQRPNNREPLSIIPPPLEHAEVSLEHAQAPRASLPLLPTPTPNPDPLERGHVFVVPAGDPPKTYLDDAVMAGVGPDRACETWEYWRTRGLPPGGVRDLHGWLLGRAKARGNAPPKSGSQATKPAKTAAEVLGGKW